jgi:hypothetical protein
LNALTNTNNNSDVGMYDRSVIQDLIKEVAQTQQVDASAKRSFKGLFFSLVTP